MGFAFTCDASQITFVSHESPFTQQAHTVGLTYVFANGRMVNGLFSIQSPISKLAISSHRYVALLREIYRDRLRFSHRMLTLVLTLLRC
jgi:hypothetical protein